MRDWAVKRADTLYNRRACSALHGGWGPGHQQAACKSKTYALLANMQNVLHLPCLRICFKLKATTGYAVPRYSSIYLHRNKAKRKRPEKWIEVSCAASIGLDRRIPIFGCPEMGISLTQHRQFLAEIVVRIAIRIADRRRNMVDVANMVIGILPVLNGTDELRTRHIIPRSVIMELGIASCRRFSRNANALARHIMPSFHLERKGDCRP